MAVKLAHAMGAEVTVLSQSLKKQEDGLRLGADHYYATSDAETFETLAGSFDLIVNTVSASIDISSYLMLLTLDGALVNVGAPAEPLPVNVFSLIMGRRCFAGSLIGGIRETQEMLDFCAEHRLGAEIELIRRRPNQRGLRTRPRLRRPLPLRDRRRHPGLAVPTGGGTSSKTTPSGKKETPWKSKPKQPSTKGPARDVHRRRLVRRHRRAAGALAHARERASTSPPAPAPPGTPTPSGRPCTSPRASDWSRPAAARSS